jgi:uncharacterized protein YecT (DUF1311 family)
VYHGDVSSLISLIRAQSTTLLATGVVLLATFLISSTPATAQHMNAANAPCRLTSDVDKTNCFVAEAKTAEVDLNVISIRIMRILREEDQDTLRAVQEKWADFREANCSAEKDLYMNGPLAPMAYYSCMAANTRQRIAELNAIYGGLLEKFGNRP